MKKLLLSKKISFLLSALIISTVFIQLLPFLKDVEPYERMIALALYFGLIFFLFSGIRLIQTRAISQTPKSGSLNYKELRDKELKSYLKAIIEESKDEIEVFHKLSAKLQYNDEVSINAARVGSKVQVQLGILNSKKELITAKVFKENFLNL